MITLILKATMFFLYFKWARALDLGRALPKKKKNSTQGTHWNVDDFQKKKNSRN